MKLISSATGNFINVNSLQDQGMADKLKIAEEGLIDLKEKVTELEGTLHTVCGEFSEAISYYNEREAKHAGKESEMKSAVSLLFSIAQQTISTLQLPTISELSPFKKRRVSYYSGSSSSDMK